MFGRKKKRDESQYDEYAYDDVYEDDRYPAEAYDDRYPDESYGDPPRHAEPPRHGGRREAPRRGAAYEDGRGAAYDDGRGAAYEDGRGAAYESGFEDVYDGDSAYATGGYEQPAAYAEAAHEPVGDREDEPASERPAGGPYDYEDVAHLLAEDDEGRLDLGSVIVPVPPGGQLQVEMTPDGTPQAVHLATQYGRLTVAAYAAPKSPGQWRTVATDLAESLRADGARVSVQDGPWGRELHAVTEGADLRFIGVDGYRWMVRLVAAGPSGAVDDGQPLVAAARAILGETVVRRGDDPLPVREPLPVVLPQELAQQLLAAHQQQVEAQQQAVAAQAAAVQATATGGFPAVSPDPQQPRRGSEGSAMQQLGRG